jgi:hypothetical protein
MPSVRKSTDRAKAGAASMPALANNHTNAAWLVPMPLTVIGSSMTSNISGTNAMYAPNPAGRPSASPSVQASSTRST